MKDNEGTEVWLRIFEALCVLYADSYRTGSSEIVNKTNGIFKDLMEQKYEK